MQVPKITLVRLSADNLGQDALVLPVFKDRLGKFSPALKQVLGKQSLEQLADFARRRGFKAAAGQTLYYPQVGGRLTLLVGLGDPKKFEIDMLRNAAARVLKILERLRVASFGLIMTEKIGRASEPELAGAATLGLLLGAYEFDKYKAKAKDKFSAKQVELILLHTNKGVQTAVREAEQTAEVVNQTRDLQNDNADQVNPLSFVAEARAAAKKYGFKVQVLAGAALAKNNLNLLRAVGRASKWPPQLIILEYRGDRQHKNNLTGLVGKGVTFDTGGVNLKPHDAMLEEMHLDMSGAATVLGTLKLASLLKLKTNLIGVLPVAENALGGNAIKPGSVVRAANGKSVEIANTDAEGRLILADGLAYLTKNYQLGRVIDIATLTGSVIVAFSFQYAGLVSNNDKISRGLLAASQSTTEKLWRLPLDDDFRKSMRGKKSDLTNVSKKGGDAIKAAAFLENFTNKVPWAHIDIAGTSMLPAAAGYRPAGGTGFGVRLLVEYLRKNPRA